MKKSLAGVVLLGGLMASTVGMALVAFGVVVSGVFFAGVYLLAAGLLATAAGAVMHLVRKTV